MIQEGLLVIPGHDPEVMSFSYLAEIFRGIGIGFGRERYLDRLKEYEKAWELRQNDPHARRDEEGEFLTAPGWRSDEAAGGNSTAAWPG